MNFYKKIIIVATLMVVTIVPVNAGLNLGVGLPLGTADTQVPVVGAASIKIGAAMHFSGHSRSMADISDGELENFHALSENGKDLWKVFGLGNRIIVASFDSLKAGEVDLAPNGTVYPFQICFNTPFKARRLGFAIANRTVSEETIRPLESFAGGWFGMMPINEMVIGVPYQILLYAELEGRRDWTYLGFIRKKESIANDFSSALSLRLVQPIRSLEQLSPEEAAIYFAEILGWDSTFMPDARAYIDMRLGQAQVVAEKSTTTVSEPVVTREESRRSAAPASPVMETRPEVSREGTLVIRFAGREPANGWPEVKIFGPDGEHFFRVPQGQTEMRVRVQVGEYRLAGVSQYGWVLSSNFSQRLGAGGSIIFDIRPKEGR